MQGRAASGFGYVAHDRLAYVIRSSRDHPTSSTACHSHPTVVVHGHLFAIIVLVGLDDIHFVGLHRPPAHTLFPLCPWCGRRSGRVLNFPAVRCSFPQTRRHISSRVWWVTRQPRKSGPFFSFCLFCHVETLAHLGWRSYRLHLLPWS